MAEKIILITDQKQIIDQLENTLSNLNNKNQDQQNIIIGLKNELSGNNREMARQNLQKKEDENISL